MNIRSIDLQVLIPQATEVSKVQHTANHQSAAQQQDFANQWQRISQERQQQVQTATPTEGGKVNQKQENEKRRKQADAKERRREQGTPLHSQEQTSQQMYPDPLLGHTIDIKT